MPHPAEEQSPELPPAPGEHPVQDRVAPVDRPGPVVMVFGLRPERLVGAEGRIDAVPEPPTQGQVGLLVEALQSGIAAAGQVVALVPDRFPREALQRLEMARSLLDTDRVAIHVTPLPPLAATALASVASSLGPRLPSAGLVASLLEPLEAELHVLTWLGSVSGLRRPTPSMGQHLASLSPASAFGVSSHPELALHRLQGGGPGVPLPAVTRPSRLVIAPRDGDEQWLSRTLAGALGGLPVLRVHPTPGGPAWWGTSKLVEGVVCPADPDGLAQELLAGVQAWSCRWCGELIARSPCPMCRNRARPRRLARGSSLPPGHPQQGARR